MTSELVAFHSFPVLWCRKCAGARPHRSRRFTLAWACLVCGTRTTIRDVPEDTPW